VNLVGFIIKKNLQTSFMKRKSEKTWSAVAYSYRTRRWRFGEEYIQKF